MTDNEIKKALECCNEPVGNNACQKCPLYHSEERCSKKMLDLSLNLITRQQAEIENLKVENQSLRSAANSLKMHYEEAQAEIERLKESLNIELENFATEYDNKIKAEAYKEFAERLKEEYAQGINWFGVKEHYFVNVEDIDNLVKEMVGDDNA